MHVLTRLPSGRRMVGLITGTLLLVSLMVAPATAASGDARATEVGGNPTCSTLMGSGWSGYELRIEPVSDGTYSGPAGFSVEIDVRQALKGQVFDWEATGGQVESVYVKGGPNGNFYDYRSGGLAAPYTPDDRGLHSPVQSKGLYYGLSHISFCYNRVVPATVKLVKVDDASGAFLGGAVLQLFADDGDGSLDSGDTQVGSDCTSSSTDGIGTCTFSITTSGTYIAHEKTAPAGYSVAPDQVQAVTLSASPQTITLTFRDVVVPGTVRIVKTDDGGAALSGVDFTLYNDLSPVGGTQGTEDTVTTLTCTTGNDGKCSIANVPLGNYWVVETSTPAGYTTAAPQTAVVGLGSTPGQGSTVTKTFVNDRAHKVIVIVCHEGSNTLARSDVTNGSGSATTLGSAPSGLTQAQICNLGGAVFSGKPHGDKSLTVDVGSDSH